MSFDEVPRLPFLIPARDSFQSGVFVFEHMAGIVINVFFLSMLLLSDRSWSAGKKLLLFVHTNELILIVTSVFPYLSAMGRDDVLETPECFLPSTLLHLTTMLEPLSIALMATLRWRIVKRSADNDNREINVNRWILGVTAASMLLLLIDLSMAYSSGIWPYFGPFFICTQWGPIYFAAVIGLFFAGAPLVLFCTYKLIKLVESQTSHGDEISHKRVQESIAVVKALTVSLYFFHVPWFIGLIKNIYITPHAVEVIQGLWIVYLAHACFSPLFTILMVERFRVSSGRFFSSLRFGSQAGSKEHKEMSASATRSKSSAHHRKTSSDFVPPDLKSPAYKNVSMASISGSTTPRSGPRSLMSKSVVPKSEDAGVQV